MHGTTVVVPVLMKHRQTHRTTIRKMSSREETEKKHRQTHRTQTHRTTTIRKMSLREEHSKEHSKDVIAAKQEQ